MQINVRMGGASSLLEETDWEKADGKISSTLDTVDGAQPTEKYELYYITKRGFNQREFDITDSKNNLLYTTRQVPGTVCSFDVLGKEIGDYKLRVHSDLARRYWVVYRFCSQSFEDQEPDREESDKAEKQLADIDVRLERPIELYKRLSVTVSWSRYLAVAAFFGPPTLEMLMEASKQEEEGEKLSKLGESSHGTDPDFDIGLHEEDISEKPSSVGRQTRARTNTADSYGSRTQEPVERSYPTIDDENIFITDKEIDENISDQTITLDAVKLSNASNHSSHASQSSSKNADTFQGILSSSIHSASSKSLSSMNVQHWIQKHSKSFRDKSRKVLHSTLASRHPSEGVVDLDKPLILCQEIYTRLIGNHQTSRVSKDLVLTLLRQDMAQHLKDNPNEGEGTVSDAPMIMTNGHLLQEDEDGSPGNGVEESKTAAGHEEPIRHQREEATSDKEEPLVAYWKWEHSFQTQKMKMHLAKNSDLALHIVVAIIVNQVRYERNAIAMTV